MKRNAKTIEETSEYKIVVDNRFDNIPLTFKIWKNTNLKELKIDNGFARAIGFNSLEDMKNKVGESIIKSLGYFPEWTILEEMDPLNNIGLNQNNKPDKSDTLKKRYYE